MANAGSDRGKAQAYNRFQRAYFEGRTKRTMVPREDRYLRRHVDEALRFGEIGPGERVAEVGCGMGRYTLLLAKRGLRLTGLDLSPVLLERLREYNVENLDLDLRCADIEDPPSDLTGTFDVVMGFFVLHHLFDLERGLHGLTRLLRSDGRVVFVEPNPLNPLYYAQILITPGISWRAERGMARMRPGIVRRYMHEGGLGNFQVERFGFFPPFLANRSWARPVESVLEGFRPWRRFLPFQLFLAHRGVA